jgi:hypothetical protein
MNLGKDGIWEEFLKNSLVFLGKTTKFSKKEEKLSDTDKLMVYLYLVYLSD